MGTLLGVVVEPCLVLDTIGPLLGGTGPGGEFPLRFGGKAVLLSRHGAKLLEKLLSVFPGDILHRIIVALLVLRRVRPHNLLP